MNKQVSRREFLRAVGMGAFGIAIRSNGSVAVSKNVRPNILFIMADDHTSQAWGCYGSRLAKYCPTRNIDRIRNEGALLRNCFCTNSICVPSRASILTGQYSHIHEAKTLSGRLDPQADNVAKRLQTAGYETAIIGKWHLKDQPAGFDYYNVLRGQGRYHNPVLFESGRDWKKGGQVRQGHSTDVITNAALRWLNHRNAKTKPYCLMVHFKAVHEPFYSHDRYRSLYANQQIPEPEDLLWPESPKGKCFEGWPLEKLTRRFKSKPRTYAPPPFTADEQDPNPYRKAAYQKFIKDYLRTVAGIDHNIGRLLAYLDETRTRTDTVVIYTSDQGYFLGEHNLFDKRFMLEESLRMPFVIRYPKEINPNTTVEDVILNIDFAELFLDYAQAEIPDTMQGKSFRPNLRQNTPPHWRDAMYYHYWTNHKERPSHYGIRTQTHKLIFYYGLVRSGRKPQQCWELYNLQTDPHERTNVYQHPENKIIIEHLKRKLQKLRREFRDTEDHPLS